MQASKARVLIVEDDLASATALRTLLAHRGYEVVHVTTLADAMEHLEGALHAVVLDLMLPDGDGRKLLEHIRGQNLPTKVLVTTGALDADRINAVKALNPERLLKKPINLADLFRGLAEP